MRLPKSAWGTCLASLCLAAAFLASGVARSGIWDPHELDRAELARRIAIHVFDAKGLAVHDAANTMPTLTDLGAGELGFTSVAAGFALFGLHDWAGRLPLALWAMAGAMALFAFLARVVRPRAGLYAVLALCTMPLYFVHARTMLGDAATMGCATLAFCGTAGALLEARSWRVTAIWLVVGLAGLIGGFFSRGVLIGVAAPLAATGLSWLVLASSSQGGAWRCWPSANARSIARTAIGGLALAGAAASVWFGVAALAHGGQVSRMLGVALVAKPPLESTFDLVVRDLGHALFPWSALLPFAFGRLFYLRGERGEGDVAVRVALLVGASAFYAVYAWLAPRTGGLPFAGPALLAAIAGVVLDDFERGAPASGVIGAGVALLAALLLFDLVSTPDKTLVAFGVPLDASPKNFVVHDEGLLRAAALSFVALMIVGWVDDQHESLSAWVRSRVRDYQRAADELGKVFKGWLVFGFLLMEAGLVGLGAMLVVGRKLGWPSVTRIPQQQAYLGLNAWWFLPLALLCAPIAFDGGRFALAALRRALRLPRGAGIALAALVSGAFLGFGFYPALASQLSPRQAFQRYAALHREGEPLATLGLRARVLHYYAQGEEPTALSSPAQAATWLGEALDQGQRRWLLVRERDLAALNSVFRRTHGQNLPVLDASGGDILLASNTLAGARNDNPLDELVLSAPPERIQHPVSAVFGDDLEALGWEIRDSDGELVRYAVPGEEYTMRFFYRVRRTIARNYQAFIHVDGYGRRHNGDHEVLDGRYRMTLWQVGDIIADRYSLTLEANFLPGDYQVFYGFFSGKPRYSVTAGSHQDDRVIGGTLTVR